MLIKGNENLSGNLFSLTILATNWHLIPILSTPHHIRLWEAFGFTCQRYVCPLSHNHIVASHRFHYYGRNWNWGFQGFHVLSGSIDPTRGDKRQKHIFVWYFTNNLQISLPRPHGIGINLAHVPSSIWLFDLPDVQVPAAMVVVSQHNSRILSDDIVMNAEDRLCVNSYPRDLNQIYSKKLQHNRVIS